MIFKISSEDIRSDNDNVDAVPEFQGQKNWLLKFCILVYDRESPYRFIPFEERKKQVFRDLGYKTTSMATTLRKEKKNIDKVAKKVQKLQPEDLDRDLYEACANQLRQYTELMNKKNKSPEEDKRIFDVMKNLTSMQESKATLERRIQQRYMGEEFQPDEEGDKNKEQPAITEFSDEA